ncbi:capsular polysaccharide biosynthesis protein [Nereida sp. MMG025]|uniref:capsular polysaccharide biosynthesis protein n=1 Tax=Nereida sp. MMG025 TaxID=2909981 RepID=UPI001F469B6D|nr:capsular polysaccharide biosynthesis protein [Nereida sp. MMG025]MCF6445139.1 capsular polysaccharide biosynthesis protein [Nereida sp. MMG025]
MSENKAADGSAPRRLFVYNGGFLTQKRIRRILELSGFDIRIGLPKDPSDTVGVWGRSPTSPRGEKVAAHQDAPIVRMEDAFLRSVLPGRDGEPPLGLLIDDMGVHFDSTTPSRLEHILRHDPLDDTALLDRARDGIKRLRRMHLSKYNAFDPDTPAPEPGYVLVIDQTKGDASITYGGAISDSFREMLLDARLENPRARILIKTHPETVQGHRAGHFTKDDATDTITLVDDAISPHSLLEGATKVYAVSSQMGFEAIMAGHKPILYGQPFYAGWGLTDDRAPIDRRQRNLSRAQLFAAAMIVAPTWYDPYRDCLTNFEGAVGALEARTRAWREDHTGWSAQGMRLWKRSTLQKVFGAYRKMTFDKPASDGRKAMIWASKAGRDTDAVRVEDGFLRSRGLGAELIPPMSLVCDDLGIYYDPTRDSRMEYWINRSIDLENGALRRAEDLRGALIKNHLSKYNLTGEMPALPKGHRILVPGQVEDDASIKKGAGAVRTNADLLRAARTANPKAVIIYKPHPDVEAGLRSGDVPDEVLACADVIAHHADALTLLDHVQDVWTITSLLGFEALLRDVRVTCLGVPFYAGWGLTHDLSETPDRRFARPSLDQLTHAALIDYPRYFDPLTQQPAPVEVIVDRLSQGATGKVGRPLRLLAKAQGIFASYAHLWR